MRINAKGQVTIPAALRARAGLTPGTKVAIAWDGNAIRVTPIPAPPSPGQGEALLAHLRRHAPTGNTLTTEETLSLTRGD